MIHEIWWSLPLTLAVYFGARWLARKLNMPLLNPLLVSMAGDHPAAAAHRHSL
ncbi:Inner membrane protein yohK [Serratia marcescens]|uniref:Inner membrane protein yohK n=1 Tax=Serratia marcescens TaxID=615 RepID=A0A380AAD4_SERMA|nr:Inner membrane protein yohK [Serratia marcescens]